MRIVSLLPSATEIVYALGLQKQLVGVSHACDYPAAARKKLILTSTEIDQNKQTSLQIDTLVKQKLHTGVGVYHIDPKALKKANPDLILTQELCDVCAVSFDEVKKACRILHGKRKIVSLEPKNIWEIFENILTVGSLAGKKKKAEEYVAKLRQRLENIKNKTKNLSRPRVFALEWMDPPYAGGHWVPEQVEIAGGIDSLGIKNKPSRQVVWEQIIEYNPEIIVVLPCGFDIPRCLKEIDVLKNAPGWEKINAVKNGRVYVTEANNYFSRSGPRVVDGVEMLAEIFHPAVFKGLAPKGSYKKVS